MTTDEQNHHSIENAHLASHQTSGEQSTGDRPTEKEKPIAQKDRPPQTLANEVAA
jgi:hypothetical protein